MSERGQFRGGRGGGGGRGGRGHSDRGGDRGGRGGGHANRNDNSSKEERPRKENILDLTRYMDKEIMVKFSGGREVTGILKGFDQLMNLVLDGVKEIVRGVCTLFASTGDFQVKIMADCKSDDEGNTSTRPLGLLVARGTLLVLISPTDGSEEIANPFVQAEDE